MWSRAPPWEPASRSREEAPGSPRPTRSSLHCWMMVKPEGEATGWSRSISVSPPACSPVKDTVPSAPLHPADEVGERLQCWWLGFLPWPILSPECREWLIHSSQRVLRAFSLILLLCLWNSSCQVSQKLPTEVTPPGCASTVWPCPCSLTALDSLSVKLCLTGQAHPSQPDPKPSLSLGHCCSWRHLLLFHVLVSHWLPGATSTGHGSVTCKDFF